MINAMQEYLEEVQSKNVKCAFIYTVGRSLKSQKFSLPLGYNAEDLQLFSKSLDFEYDNGHSEQELDGVIWYNDGTWSSRGEYDGAEWWEYHEVPNIPEFLVKK